MRMYEKDKKGSKLPHGKSVGGKGWVTDPMQRKSVLNIEIREENNVLNERQKQTRMLMKRFKLEHLV